jgi:hypothetical protein
MATEKVIKCKEITWNPEFTNCHALFAGGEPRAIRVETRVQRQEKNPVNPHVHRGWLSSLVHAYIFLVTMFIKDGDG